MELCVDNMERREFLEKELEEAKEILQKTLCGDCKSNLKKRVQRPKKSGITVKGKGNALILSILAVSVAMVTLGGQTEIGQQTALMVPQPDVDMDLEGIQATRRNLEASYSLDNTKALQVYEPESESLKLT